MLKNKKGRFVYEGKSIYLTNLICSNCDKKLPPRRSCRISKTKGIQEYKHHFCNKKCQAEFYKKNNDEAKVYAKGENNPNYKKVDITKIKELYKKGVQQKEIAKKLGVHHHTIQRRVKQHNILRYEEKEIISDYISGKTLVNIMKEYRITHTTLKKILLKHNVPFLKNYKQGKGWSDGKVMEILSKQEGMNIISRGNLCLINGRLPLEICKKCPIKTAQIKTNNYFDFVLNKEGLFYVCEVKNRDGFTYNQTMALLHLLSQGVNICVIKARGGKNEQTIRIESTTYFKGRTNKQ